MLTFLIANIIYIVIHIANMNITLIAMLIPLKTDTLVGHRVPL